MLRVADVEIPGVGRTGVRFNVHGAAVNRIDLSVRAGYLVDAGLLLAADRYYFGWDVAGIVDDVGRDVTRFRPGDAVVGLRALLSTPGTHAEAVVLDESAVAPAPPTVDLITAAALPLGLLTADGALRASGVHPGECLLVTGADGVVGQFVIELAVTRGIEVVAHGRPTDVQAIAAAGARYALDQSAAELAATVRAVYPRGVDAVIDAATLGIAAHDALRREGRFVALVRPTAPPPLRGTQVVVHETHADGLRLGQLLMALRRAALDVRVDDTFTLDEAALAHERIAAGGVRGRVVLVP